MQTTLLILFLALNQGQALQRAKLLWGDYARVTKDKTIMTIGCIDSDGKFHAAGVGTTWDEALAAVNLAINGPHKITAVARDAAGNKTESAPITRILCNGPIVPVG